MGTREKLGGAHSHNASGDKDQGKFRVVEMVEWEFADGSGVIAPAGEVSFSARGVASTIGDIITIACKLFPKLCGEKDPGDGGGGGGCYVIIGPDGTKITICPPGKGGIA